MTTFGSMSGRSTNKFNKIISFLTQKIIDSETSSKEVFDSGEDNLPENIDMFDIEMERDLGTRSTLKTTGNVFRMVEGATWTKRLRLWVKFQSAGHLYDYAKNGNFTEVYGLGQIPILMNKKVPENVLGWEFHSFFNGQDQFAYTVDNPQIRISAMFADSAITHISFLDSFNPISISTQHTAHASVLFSKVDDDQLKDGYAATMNHKGDLFFYVRRNFKQYSLFLHGIYAQQLQDEIEAGGDFLAENFDPRNFNTDKSYVTNLICSITKTNDHWFVYQKSNHNLKYMMNGEDVFQSTDSFIVDPILDVPFQDGAYNSDGSDRTVINDITTSNNNGTLVDAGNGQWQTDNTFFSFGSNSGGTAGGSYVTFPSITAINTATELTISLMFKPDNIVNTKNYDAIIFEKNTGNSSFRLRRLANSGDLRFTYVDSLGVSFDVTKTNAFTTTDWQSIVIKLKAAEPLQLFVNNVVSSGGTPAAVTTSGNLQLFDDTKAERGTICYFRVFTTKLGTTDTDRLFDEGYHNPVFPKAEKPQPVPDPSPPPVLIPFEAFYNLAYANTTSESNVVWLNSIAGNAPFFEIYNVADGVDTSDPELLKYDVPDGVGTAGDPFVEFYTYSPTDNSSVQLSDTDNSAGGVGVKTGSAIIGKKVTVAKFQLKAENTPVGSVYCRIWNASGAIVATLDYWNGTTLGTLNAANVTSDWVEYEFRNTTYNWGATSVQADWVIGVEYAAPDGSNDVIHLRRQSSGNPMPNEQQAGRNTGNSTFSFDTSNGRDVGAKFSTGLGTTSTDPNITLGSGGITTVSESFGATAHNLLNLPPTKIILRLKKSGTPSGSFSVVLMNSAGTVLSTFTGPTTANSLTTTTADYTFTNLANTVLITNGVQIGISYGGTGGNVIVMTNKGNTTAANATNTGGTNNYHGATSYLRKYQAGWTNDTAVDLSAKIYTGGGSFDADIKFTDSLTRVYVKAAHTSSSLSLKALTKATVKLRKTGSPTGLISCVVRKGDGTDGIRFNVGTYDVSLLTGTYQAITFTNIFNTTQIQVNDRVSFEYSGSTATNYIEILTNKDVFETTNTIAGTYSAPVYTDNAQRDISGIFYRGGEPDLASRIRCAQKIMSNDSVMDGEKLTKIRVYLKKSGSPTGNIHCIIYRGSDDSPIVTIGSPLAASSLTTSWIAYDFENTNNGYVADVNDKVAIVFEGGDSTNKVGVNVVNPSTYDGANSHVVRYNGSAYDDLLNSDMSGTMWRGGYLYQPPANAIPDPTPTNNKDLLFCAGNNLLAGFARVLMREFRIYVEDTTTQEAINMYENRYSKTSRSPQEVLVAGIYKPF